MRARDLFDLKLHKLRDKILKKCLVCNLKGTFSLFSVDNVFIFVSHHGKSERESGLYGSLAAL